MNLRTKLLCGLAAIVTATLAAQAQVPGINSTLQSVFTLAYDNSTMKPTYSAFQTNIVPAASQTDMCTLTGSATRRVKVRRIFWSHLPTTAISEPIAIVKRSTANTGAGTALPSVAYDSANPATTIGTAEVWTAAPTTGTLVGVLSDILIGNPATAAAVQSSPYVFEFGRLGQPIVLRGIAQSVSINLSGVTFTGTIGCGFEWTEDND